MGLSLATQDLVTGSRFRGRCRYINAAMTTIDSLHAKIKKQCFSPLKFIDLGWSQLEGEVKVFAADNCKDTGRQKNKPKERTPI